MAWRHQAETEGRKRIVCCDAANRLEIDQSGKGKEGRDKSHACTCRVPILNSIEFVI